MRSVLVLIAAFGIFQLASAGCRGGRSSAYRPADQQARDPQRAASLTSEAADAIESDELEKAESLLRDALGADLFHGPAHNNLGVVYLKQGKLYSAASEFEWARKLMPGQPDPRINLAITLERAGQVRDAEEAYRSAMEIAPLHIDAMTGLARLRVVASETDRETVELLSRIEAMTDDPGLRAWARDQRLRLAYGLTPQR
ncbi:MAG: tetratricopeptide repeat protein [Planctomycetota bacterium]